MKAMVLNERKPIEENPLTFTEVPDPEPTPGEIRVRVRACGICRTDLHVVEAELPPVKSPLIPGHQVVGIVDRTGKGAARFKIGDRIGIAWLRKTCGECGFFEKDLRSVTANTRKDGRELLEEAAEIPIRPRTQPFPLEDANMALQALKHDRISGSGVLMISDE